MLKAGSWIYACDNSGAIKLKVLHIFKSRFRTYTGRIALIIVKTAYSATKRKVRIKIDNRYKALIVREKIRRSRDQGYYIAFRNYSAIIFAIGPSYAKANVYNPIAKRIHGPVSYDLRYKGFSRITSMARRLI
jgi:ribosomal protein L14